eukprot:79628-Hanusia_phi.AAC.1
MEGGERRRRDERVPRDERTRDRRGQERVTGLQEREEFSGLLRESPTRRRLKELLLEGPGKRHGSEQHDNTTSCSMTDSRRQADMIKLLQDRKVFSTIVVEVDPDADAEFMVPLCSCAVKDEAHGVATLRFPRGCFLRRVKLRLTLGSPPFSSSDV